MSVKPVTPPLSKEDLIQRLSEIDSDELHDALSRLITSRTNKVPTNYCPHCGFNLRNDLIVQRNRFVIDPRGAVTYKNKSIQMSRMMASVMHTLAKANGRVVSAEVIMNRCSNTERLDDTNNLKVYVRMIRKRLQELGIPNPIQTKWGQGYYWHIPATGDANASLDQ